MSEMKAISDTVSFLLARDFGFRKEGEMGVELPKTPENQAFIQILPAHHVWRTHREENGSIIRVTLVSRAAEMLRQSHHTDIHRGLKKAAKAFKRTPTGIADDLGITAAHAAKTKEKEND